MTDRLVATNLSIVKSGCWDIASSVTGQNKAIT